MRLIPQLLDQYPLIAEGMAWLKWINGIWREFQGLFVISVLSLLWWLLRREGLRLADRIETLRQIVTAVRDQSEEALASPPPAPEASVPSQRMNGTDAASGREFFEFIRERWRDARDRIELAIEDIPRPGVRRKYGRLSRYTYRDVILAMEQDGLISSTARTRLLDMNDVFNQLKFRPATATRKHAVSFEESYQLGTRELPQLEGDDVPPQIPPASLASQQQHRQKPYPAA